MILRPTPPYKLPFLPAHQWASYGEQNESSLNKEGEQEYAEGGVGEGGEMPLGSSAASLVRVIGALFRSKINRVRTKNSHTEHVGGVRK